MKARYHIGIDGGVKTGLAVWDRETKKFDTLETVDFWQVVDLLVKYCDRFYERENTVVYIEDPSQNKPVFMKKGANNRAKIMKVAQNVGGVKRETELLIEGLERMLYTVKRIQPSSSKWDSKTFKSITGYKKRCSQHARDAAKLVYGY